MKPLSPEEKRRYGIKSGVAITELGDGLLARQTQIRKGFVILSVNNKAINSADDLLRVLSGTQQAQIAGFYPGNRGMFYYGIRLDGEQLSEQ